MGAVAMHVYHGQTRNKSSCDEKLCQPKGTREAGGSAVHVLGDQPSDSNRHTSHACTSPQTPHVPGVFGQLMVKQLMVLAITPPPPRCTRNTSAGWFPHTPEGTYPK